MTMGSIKFICLNYCPKGERSDNYLPTYLQKNKINKQDMKIKIVKEKF